MTDEKANEDKSKGQPKAGEASAPARSGSKAPIAIVAVVVAVVVVLVVVLVFMNNSPTLASPLEGRWDIMTYHEQGQVVENATGYIEFNDDGTGTKVITSPTINSVSNFTWVKSGGRLTIGGVSATYTIIEDTITLSCNFWGLSGTKA